MQIATGEVAETAPPTDMEYARKGGLKGGKARAKKLFSKRREEIARRAARARRKKKPSLSSRCQTVSSPLRALAAQASHSLNLPFRLGCA
jgi:hypothetical protein